MHLLVILFYIYRHTDPAVIQIAFQYSVIEPIEEASGDESQSSARYITDNKLVLMFISREKDSSSMIL